MRLHTAPTPGFSGFGLQIFSGGGGCGLWFKVYGSWFVVSGFGFVKGGKGGGGTSDVWFRVSGGGLRN